jgi:Zn-dependent protease
VNESLRLGRIAGVAVGINWSLLVIFWLITWSLAAYEFPTSHEGHAAATYWAVATVTSVVFFACLLAHELGHAVMARRLGMKVEGITLWLFGGVAKLEGEAATPDDELRVGAIGPIISLAAAAAFWILTLLLEGVGVHGLAVAVPSWLARINLILGLFNLVPAFPLDGGRVLQALLWRRHGDRLRATATAASAGRTFAYVLIALGLAQFATGASAGGLWFVFLGWFLLSAARAEEGAAVTSELLAGVKVSDVMTPDPIVAPATMTLADVLEHYALRHRCSAFPLVDDAGRLVGLLTLGALKSVPPARRTVVTAASVACPIAEVPTARPDDELVDLLGRLTGRSDGRALVLDDGRLIGIVSPTDISRIVQVMSMRAADPTSRRSPAAS